MSENKKLRILLCGGALKGNMGAPAMYDSIIDELKKSIPDPEVTVLSKYPHDDREECEKRGYRMAAFPTIRQLIDGDAFSSSAVCSRRCICPAAGRSKRAERWMRILTTTS